MKKMVIFDHIGASHTFDSLTNDIIIFINACRLRVHRTVPLTDNRVTTANYYLLGSLLYIIICLVHYHNSEIVRTGIH